MCGVAGLYVKDLDHFSSEKINLALDTLNHRGPDATGLIRNQKICLGHKRLSIIDLNEKANQPFSDSKHALSFNGEIYNFLELRRELEIKGIVFQTKSDTEVLFQLLKTEGKNAISKLEGCFAFAFADLDKQEIILARDRFGINPLYYLESNGDYFFSSEMRFISALLETKDLDSKAIDAYFSLSYIPYSNSIFKKARKLSPGTLLLIDKDGHKEEKYYSIPRKPVITYSREKAQNKLREVLNDAVEKRLISDVPLGSFLSGGIDSSVIASIAAKKKKDFKTFSIGFEDASYFDETHYAEIVAEHIGSEHRTIKLSTTELYESAKELLNHYDEPFADSSAIAVNLLCKEVRKHVKVALSGDGADEIFSGYNKHQAEYLLLEKPLFKAASTIFPKTSNLISQSRDSKFGNLSRKLSKLKEGAKLNSRDRYIKWLKQLDINTQELLLKNDPYRFQDYSIEIEDFNDILYYDTRIILPNDMLFKVDSSSMKNSLEVRTPFLDTKVVEYAFSLPKKLKISNSRRKMILRDTFKSDLPTTIFDRRKKGFEIPLRQILLESLNIEIESLLNENLIKYQNLFRYEYIATLLQKLKSQNPGNSAQQVWSLLVFQSFWNRYLNAENT